jgi:D-3-phosphoglycerate dehydrogenase
MNVLIADHFEPQGIDALRAAGCDVTCDPALEGDALREAVVRTGCRVLIVRGTPVTASVIEATDTLGVIVRAGVDAGAIDLSAASRRCVLVAKCPGRDADAIAELTFALILGLDRRLVNAVNDLRQGVWNRAAYCRAPGLKGRTLGVVGMGQVGEAVARRALAFEMDVVVWSRLLTYERAGELGVLRCNTPADVAARCDILTIHLTTPLADCMIDAGVLDRLKPGSYVINTCRADVMDYDALARAMEARDLRVGLDVYPDEPPAGEGTFSNALLTSDRLVYGTPHIGASTEQARDAVSHETVAIVKEYLRTGRVRNCINLCEETVGRYVLVVRHRNRPGVLAHTLNVVSHAGANVEEMENVVCDGAEAGCAQIKLDGPLDETALSAIKSGNEHIIAVSLISLGP